MMPFAAVSCPGSPSDYSTWLPSLAPFLSPTSSTSSLEGEIEDLYITLPTPESVLCNSSDGPSSGPASPCSSSSSSSLDWTSIDSLSSTSEEDSSPVQPPTSSQCNALIPTFKLENGWASLDSVLNDPALRSFARFAIGSPLEYHPASGNDILPRINYGEVSYIVRPTVCSIITDTFNRTADFILCAGNGHNPWILGGRPNIQHSISVSTLEEIMLHLPGVVLFRSYTTCLADMEFRRPQDAVECVAIAVFLYHYTLHWIADAMRRSTEFGCHTSWRWGAPMGMSHEEFVHRITRYFVYGGYKSLERMMSHQLTRNAMDFACSTFFSLEEDEARCLLSIERADRARLALFPLNHPTDSGDQFVHLHLQELQCDAGTLSYIVEKNNPSS
ncbi:hypothetical protein K438DRAFT_2023505 [Mycena galopus ATCC 62051]|nr:hypothetical protein K438DRAFT_2023505 [Mycena galopus ATCC 62051]